MSFCHFSLGLAALGKGNLLAIQCKNLSIMCDGNKCRKSGRGGWITFLLLPALPALTIYTIFMNYYALFTFVSCPGAPVLMRIPTVGGAVQSQQRLLRFQGFRALTKGKVNNRTRYLREEHKMMRNFSSAWKAVVSAFQDLSITELWWKITLLLHSINKVLTLNIYIISF